MHDVQAPFPAGSLIAGRYTVIDVLGEHASGAVYLVSDKDSRHVPNRFVLQEMVYGAHKERRGLPFDAAFLRRLNHPALPRIHRAFWNDKHDRAYILMNYIEGDTLDIMQQQLPYKQISFPQAVTLISPIVSAVSYLHQQRSPLIHGNIKPSNIILPKTGSPAVLVNFVDGKENSSDANATDQRTSDFRAPEQYRGRTSVRTDVYALGAILYTLLTGSLPPSASDRLKQLDQKEPDPLLPVNQIVPSVPETVARTIHRAMSINSHDRFSSVEQFWEALWQVVFINSTATLGSVLTADAPTEEEKGQDDSATAPLRPTWLLTPPSDENTALNAALAEPPLSSPTVTEPEKEIATPIANPTTQEETVSSANAFPVLPLTPAFPTEGKPSANVQGGPFIHRSQKTNRLFFLFLGFALLVSIVLGSGLWFYTAGHRGLAIAVVPAGHQFKATPHPSASLTSRVTATPDPRATSSPFPNVARPYNGTIYDISNNVKTKMSLTDIQQQQGNIRGNFSGLLRNSSFDGTISTTGHVHFIVVGNGQQAAISFDGSMRSGGNLVGSYCDSNAAGRCSDYGLWSVSPK